MKKEPASWLGRPIMDPSHAQDLERDSAILQFSKKLPRAEAEAKAHADYQRNQHLEAAAHHLRGAKAAQGSGDMEAARAHGTSYETHMRALGHEPTGPVPTEVMAKIGGPSHQPITKFKSHPADVYAIAPKPADPAPAAPPMVKAEIRKQLGRIQALSKALTSK